MRLTELNPWLFRIKTEDGKTVLEQTGHIPEADGIMILCPQCFRDNGGRVGTHSLKLLRPHVGQDEWPGGGRWAIHATSFEDMSLVAGSSSVLLEHSPCHAHFLVQNGEIAFCGDSGHPPNRT